MTVVDKGAGDAISKVAKPKASTATGALTTPPTVNVTVPVGMPAVEVTLAVKVTVLPITDGFADDTKVVTVVAFETVIERDNVVAA